MSTQVSDQISDAPIGLGSQRSLPKRGIDVYTMMLIISFACMLTASILMFVEWGRWDRTTAPPSAAGTAATSVHPALSTAVAVLASTRDVDRLTS